MARVVQQRSGPPYLLILMVFLFLIAATLAVLGYMKGNKVQAECDKRAETQNKVARPDDLRDPVIQQMISRYDSPPPGEKRKSVVRQFLDSMEELTALVTGQPTDAGTAIAVAAETLKSIGSNRGLATEVRSLSEELESANQQLAQKDQLLAEKQQQLADKDAEIHKATADMQAKIDALQAKVDELDAKLADAHKTYQEDLAAERQKWQKEKDDLNKNISDKTATIQNLQQDKAELTKLITKLKDRIQKETSPKADPMTTARRADGKILKIIPQARLCYIDLGSKDNVSAGLTFTVYPSTGVTEDGEGKGTLVVTMVSETVSECRLVSEKRDDPVVAGDLVANIAFDPTRTYTFVVIGNFDLHGTGQATPEGAGEVKTLLKRFGGRMADKVDIDTDFVIRGDRPMLPDPPPEYAPAQEQQVYREQMKVVEEFDRQEALARSLRIPLLSPNRFLAFIGYTPTRAGG